MDSNTKLECALQQDTLSGFMDHLEEVKTILHLLDGHLSHFYMMMRWPLGTLGTEVKCNT